MHDYITYPNLLPYKEAGIKEVLSSKYKDSSADLIEKNLSTIANIPYSAGLPNIVDNTLSLEQLHYYFNEDKSLSMIIARFVSNDKTKKSFRPYTYCKDNDNNEFGWYARFPSDSYPLYGLDLLTAHTMHEVLFHEGEKAADSGKILFSDYINITTAGGSNAPNKTDFTPLKDRSILIWPDNDEPGMKYAERIAKLSLEAGAKSVRILNIRSL